MRHWQSCLRLGVVRMAKRDLARLFSKEQNPHFQVLLTCKPLSKLEYKTHIILHCRTCGCHRKFKIKKIIRVPGRRPKMKCECSECGRKEEF